MDWFIEDRLYSGMYSSNFEYIVAYLKKYGIKGTNYIYKIDNTFVPLFSIMSKFDVGQFNQIKEILDKLEINFNWIISIWKVNNIIDHGKDRLVTVAYNKFRNNRILDIAINLIPSKLNINNKLLQYDTSRLDYLFHVTDRSYLNKILSKGLIPKSKNKGTFEYPEYVHLLRYLNGSIVRLNNGKLLVDSRMQLKDPVLLKVGPLERLNGMYFMLDPNSYKDALVCFNTISPDYITVVDKDEYPRLFDKYGVDKSIEKLATAVFSDMNFV